MLTLHPRLSTEDVDTKVRIGDGPVNSAKVRVARELGLPQHWLNQAVTQYTARDPIDDRQTPFFGEYPSGSAMPALRVRIATPEYLLAMKILAARPSTRDLKDIEALAERPS